MEQLLFPRLRPRLLTEAKGRALELGVGTGWNFLYRPQEEQAATLGLDAAESALSAPRESHSAFGLISPCCGRTRSVSPFRTAPSPPLSPPSCAAP
jgi:hypothetical protein